MQHLRLVGVHEDGLHLLLADDEGNRFTVPLDEALRAAARRDRPRLGQLQIEISGGLRPKDVQAMIRAGMTAEEVAERAGWTVEKVHRYEGPILAEREHVASLARQVRLRPRGGSHGGAPTLDARVAERLRTREIDADSAQWDSRRTDKGAWTVLLLFNAGGRQREAAWSFDPLARTVVGGRRRGPLAERGRGPAGTGPHPRPAPRGVHPSEPRLRRRGRGRRRRVADASPRGRDRRPHGGHARAERTARTSAPPQVHRGARARRGARGGAPPRGGRPRPPRRAAAAGPHPPRGRPRGRQDRHGRGAGRRRGRPAQGAPHRAHPAGAPGAQRPGRGRSRVPGSSPPTTLRPSRGGRSGDDETDGRRRQQRRGSAEASTSEHVEQRRRRETPRTPWTGRRRRPWSPQPRSTTRTGTRRVAEPEAPTTSPMLEERPLRPAVRRRPEPQPVSRTARRTRWWQHTPHRGLRRLRRGRRRPRGHRGAPAGSAGASRLPAPRRRRAGPAGRACRAGTTSCSAARTSDLTR